MANQEHLDVLKQGVSVWNKWREEHPGISPDLRGARLESSNLREANFRRVQFNDAVLSNTELRQVHLTEANLSHAQLNGTFLFGADLRGANLTEASLVHADLGRTFLHGTNFQDANLTGADFRDAYLFGADLRRAVLKKTNFSKSDLSNANLEDTDLSETDFTGAYLFKANLRKAYLYKAILCGAVLVETNLTAAILSHCSVYGISVWKVRLEEAKQESLVITPDNESSITVDNLKIAQFIYLLLSNQEIRDVIDTITSKVVLILGRFTDERKMVLDALREELRQHNLTPVLFDFERPASRDFTETARTLAHLARFILVDITEPSSIPQELQAIVPDLEVPVQPLLQEGKEQYAIFPDFGKYSWVLPAYYYKDQAGLIATLKNEIVDPANKKARELAIEKAKRLEKL